MYYMSHAVYMSRNEKWNFHRLHLSVALGNKFKHCYSDLMGICRHITVRHKQDIIIVLEHVNNIFVKKIKATGNTWRRRELL